MVVFGYVRVSTTEQVSGYGIDSQEAAILDYCEKESLPVPSIIRETGSGEDLFKRPQILTLISRAEDLVDAGNEVIIVFYKLDRLSRKLAESESVIIKSFQTGVQFRSTDPLESDLLSPQYQDDPMRVAMRQIVGVFAQLERKIIQARLDGGLAVKAAQGGFTGGTPPLGYKTIEKELVIDENLAPAIRRVFRMKRAQVANTTILALCARDFPVCSKWHKSYISRILKREELYCQGKYKPRGGDVTFTLPNLIIVHNEADPAEELAPKGEIPWDMVSDPIKLDSLAILLDIEQKKLKKLMLKHSFRVAWSGSKTSVPKKIAQELCELSKDRS